jgi:hypothetical protein
MGTIFQDTVGVGRRAAGDRSRRFSRRSAMRASRRTPRLRRLGSPPNSRRRRLPPGASLPFRCSETQRAPSRRRSSYGECALNDSLCRCSFIECVAGSGSRLQARALRTCNFFRPAKDNYMRLALPCWRGEADARPRARGVWRYCGVRTPVHPACPASPQPVGVVSMSFQSGR